MQLNHHSVDLIELKMKNKCRIYNFDIELSYVVCQMQINLNCECKTCVSIMNSTLNIKCLPH